MPVQQFRKKPIVIEAIQWDGKNFPEILKWSDGQVQQAVHPPHYSDLLVHTLEGAMTAGLGDYIIKGIKGEFYPCKPGVFDASYEFAGEAHPDGLWKQNL